MARTYSENLAVRINRTNISVAAVHLDFAGRSRRAGRKLIARNAIAAARKARIECGIYEPGHFRKAVLP